MKYLAHIRENNKNKLPESNESKFWQCLPLFRVEPGEIALFNV
jgi:hypothetical protein